MVTVLTITRCLIEDALRWVMLLFRSTEAIQAENLFLPRQLALYIERGCGHGVSMPPAASAWRCWRGYSIHAEAASGSAARRPALVNIPCPDRWCAVNFFSKCRREGPQISGVYATSHSLSVRLSASERSGALRAGPGELTPAIRSWAGRTGHSRRGLKAMFQTIKPSNSTSMSTSGCFSVCQPVSSPSQSENGNAADLP